MTRQEIFDTVARHLLAQNKKSLNGATCVYRDGYGLSCAIGCLIADQHYTPNIESHTLRLDISHDNANFGSDRQAHSSEKQGALVRAISDSIGRDLTFEDRRLLVKLQNVHDCWAPRDWHLRLTQLADLLSLTFPNIGDSE